MPLDSTTFAPSVIADLQAARAYIEDNGWCQNQTRDGLRVCAFGAIFAVTGGHAPSSIGLTRRAAACGALQNALAAKLGRFQFVGPWQDEDGRTVDDVLAVYDLAIERELSPS